MSGDNPVGFLMKVVKKERRVIISLFNEGSFFDSLEIPFISFYITILYYHLADYAGKLNMNSEDNQAATRD